MKLCPTCGAHYPTTVAQCPEDGTRLVADFQPLDLVGQMIAGKYELRRELGEGGMGRVYLAYQGAMDRYVAVKVLHPDIAQDEKAVTRFLREVRAASRLTHPNTIRIYDFGRTDKDLLYMVLEVLKGRSLADIIDNDGPMTAERAVHITRQIADSLAEAHQFGVIHRDLKPDNIFIEKMFGNPDHVKVLDFGIAKLDGTQTGVQTETGVICGTPTYMSPEQIEGTEIDGRADIYGLGCLLYEMLVGLPPFLGDSPFEVLVKHLNDAIPPLPDDVAARTPARLVELLERMLAKDPTERPETCQDLHELLVKSVEKRPKTAPGGMSLSTIAFSEDDRDRIEQGDGKVDRTTPKASPKVRATAPAARERGSRVQVETSPHAPTMMGDAPPEARRTKVRETPRPARRQTEEDITQQLRASTPAPGAIEAPLPSNRVRRATPLRNSAAPKAAEATRGSTPTPPLMPATTPDPEDPDTPKRSRRVRVSTSPQRGGVERQPKPTDTPEKAQPSTAMRPTRIATVHPVSGDKFDVIASGPGGAVLHCLSGPAPPKDAPLLLVGLEHQFQHVEMNATVLGPAPDVPLPGYIQVSWDRIAAAERRHHLVHAVEQLMDRPTPTDTDVNGIPEGQVLAYDPATDSTSLEATAIPDDAPSRRATRRGTRAATPPGASKTATPQPQRRSTRRPVAPQKQGVERPWDTGDER